MTSAARWEVVVLGSHADMAVLPFEAAWGSARVAAPDDPARDGADLTIALDPQVHSGVDVVWHPAATSPDDAIRVVARPWPVADDLFDSLPAPPDDACLVIASPGEDADGVVERLRERRLRVQLATEATRELLAETRIVVSLTPGLPAETFAILAARRLLVAPADIPACGLQPWIDHVTFSNQDELVELLEALVAYPASWTPILAFGRQAAAAQRAGQAIGRLVRRMQVGG